MKDCKSWDITELSIYLSIYLFIYLFIYLSIYIYTIYYDIYSIYMIYNEII